MFLSKVKWCKIATLLCLTTVLTLPANSWIGAARANESQENQARTSGLPGRRIGAGTRSESCASLSQPLAALIPENIYSQTGAAKPHFFFYVPATKNSKIVEFVLRNANDDLVYETVFPVNSESGVVSLSLPEATNSHDLQPNQQYHWYLSLICNPEDRSEDIVVEGIIKRVIPHPQLASQLEKSQPLEQVDLYLEAGLWHEALATLAQIHKSESDKAVVTDKFKQLLQLAELDTFIKEPLTF